MPGLIYTRDKPKKKKLTLKQIKDRQELVSAAKALKDKWANAPKFAERNSTPEAKKKKKAQVEGPPALVAPPGREADRLPSRVTPGGDGLKKPDKVYTGDKVIGIATMHKSNAIAVFDDKHLVDIAMMRRNDYERDVKKKPNDPDATWEGDLGW